MAHKSHILRLLFLAGSCAWTATAGVAAQKPITGPADMMTEIGTLTCSLAAAEGEGASAGVGRDMICRFQLGQQGPQEVYTGSVQGVGRTDLLFGTGAVLLSVKMPASIDATPGMLTQTYAVDAGSSGGAAAPLTGERNKMVVLQPLAEREGRVAEGKTQPDSVIIRVELTLQSTST